MNNWLARVVSILLILVLGCWTASGQIVEKYIDIGASDDENADFTNSEIRLQPLEGPDWDSYWTQDDRYRENPASATGWYPYADLADLPGPGPWISMRLVRGLFQAEFYADSTGFPLTAGNQNQFPLYLTIRYKDINFDPALDRFYGVGEGPGASVNGCNATGGCTSSSSGWQRFGTVGGSHDMQWKTKTLQIPAESVVAIGGEFRFRISARIYGGSDVYGEVAVDWIKLSNTDERPVSVDFDEDYGISAGFWPSGGMNPNFANFATTGYLHEDDPFFPIGIFVIGTHFYWQDDTDNYLTNARDTGFNTVIYNGWEAFSQNGGWFWGEKDLTNTANYRLIDGGSTSPYPARYLGFPDFLDFAEDYGLMAAPVWATDMMSYYVYNMARSNPGSSSLYGYPSTPYNGTYPGVIEAMEMVVEANKDHPALLFWYIKDEADHVDESWGSPLESVRWAYQAVTEADGDHPCLVTNMGWRSLMFRHYLDTYDIGAFDRYPSSFVGQNSYDKIAEWSREFVYQTDGQRMFIPIMQTEVDRDVGVFSDLFAARISTYLGLIHGAQGLLYFNDPGPNTNLDVYAGCGTDCGPLWWDELADLMDEINQLAYTALHNSVATTVGYVWGDSQGSPIYEVEHTTWGEGTTSNTQIHALFRENLVTTDRYLLTMNPYEQATSATFAVSTLKAGDTIQILFENRTITASNGSFTDNFAGGQRHVYFFSGDLIFRDDFDSGGTDAWSAVMQ